MKLTKQYALGISILLVALTLRVTVSTSKAQVPKPEINTHPNIVLIFMDDMGYGDVDAYGGTGYSTPNIDKLASQGMRFTNFYAAQPICSASRAGLLTGTYPNRIGMTGALFPHSHRGLNSKETTIAEMLKKKGYATGIIGKWHLGDTKKFLPLQQGFDYFYGLPYSNDMWPHDFDGKRITDTTNAPGFIKRKFKMPRLPLIKGNKTERYVNNMHDMGMLTTWYTQKATQFIDKHKRKPFFLYLAHTMPHVPIAVSDKFKGKSKQSLYGDVMMEIDWSVGQIMDALKANGLSDNTLIIFTSDNGPWLSFGNHAGSAGGLREGKFTTFEGGMREPSIMRWPGVIPSGTINNNLASSIDLLPTFSAITDAQLTSRKIDGVNILPLLQNEDLKSPRDHLLFYNHRNDLEAVRQGYWKLVLPHSYKSVKNEAPGKGAHRGGHHTDSTPLALYNLRRDPGERYDVKKQHPAIVKQIMQIVAKARMDLGDNLTDHKGKNRRPPGRQ